VRVEPGWDAFLRGHVAGCVLVPKGSPLGNILSETGQWQILYSDDVALLFADDAATSRRTRPD